MLPISKDTKDQEEYFNAKIMEIDQDLLRFESCQGGNHGIETDQENVSNPKTEIIEVVFQSPPDQLIPQGKAEEHASHMDKGKNHKPQEVSSEPKAYTAPKWKKLARKQNCENQEVLPFTSQKQSGPETDEHEQSNKRGQVFHENQENFYVLAEAVSQPRQEQ